MSEWISVKERLPEDKTPVLVVYKNFNDNTELLCDLIACRYYGDWCYWDGEPCSYEECNVEVTHWMPLPEPPKEGGGENA